MKRKGGHQSKPIGYQGCDPKIPSLSLNNKTRMQGEDFLGHRLQAQSSPSNNFGAPRKQGTFWDEQDPEETHQTRVDEKSTRLQEQIPPNLMVD